MGKFLFLPVVMGNSCISHFQPQVLAPKGAAGACGSEAGAREQVPCLYQELSVGSLNFPI